MTDDRRALLFALAAVLFWSTVATAFKLALRYLDVFQLLLVASTTSAALLLGVVVVRKQLGLMLGYLRESPGYFLGVAVINPCIYYLILLTAYDLLPAQQAQVINYTWAITLSLLALLVLGQRLQLRDVLAMCVGYSGVVVIATRGDIASLQVESVAGVVLALVSTLVWASYWIINARNRRDKVVSMCLNFLLAVPLCLLLCSVFSSPKISSWPGLGAAVYVGLFEMGITFVLWSMALQATTRIARISSLIFLAPFLSLYLIQTVLKEPIHASTMIGLLLIVPAAMFQQLQRPKGGE
ncbi:MAG: DMT family transporter [Gammaproteobacteria bacterium]|nr:DMT family transporter [Gammaproteobacteria bacterium]